MNGFDHCLHRIALLDQADQILSEVRLFSQGLPTSAAIALQRARLAEARRRLETAQSLGQSLGQPLAQAA